VERCSSSCSLASIFAGTVRSYADRSWEISQLFSLTWKFIFFIDHLMWSVPALRFGNAVEDPPVGEPVEIQNTTNNYAQQTAQRSLWEMPALADSFVATIPVAAQANNIAASVIISTRK
jgi:hypothetical protein